MYMNAGAGHPFVGLHGHPGGKICGRNGELSDPRGSCHEDVLDYLTVAEVSEQRHVYI